MKWMFIGHPEWGGVPMGGVSQGALGFELDRRILEYFLRLINLQTIHEV